ncbi:hypothetical protein Scep_007750 [Stephania cephalantha]|uniref:Uncharacterized protein n=1 Tax=Stephania cephalantha TaxID=152367 RepID=A0AAP0KAF6_9MAGN
MVVLSKRAPTEAVASVGVVAGRCSAREGGSSVTRSQTTRSLAAAPSAREESFGLVSGGDPLAFAMIIRLAPNLVDEIRRVEADGETPRIKFDSNANNLEM